MKPRHLFALLLFVPASALAQTPSAPPAVAAPAPIRGELDWSEIQTWPLATKPLSFVHSLDNQKVFVLGADSKVHIYTTDGEELGSLSVDPGVTAIDIAPRGELLYAVNSKDNTFTAYTIDFVRQINIKGAPIHGNENAPITLIVFSDFQCPHCGKVPPLLKELETHYPGKIKTVFKHLPLAMHPEAEPAALAAIAAQNQGKFWEMHDALFASPALNSMAIEQAAKQIGLDMEQFRRDLGDPATRNRLMQDMVDARDAEINGTPALFINGHRARSRAPQDLQKMIDKELAATVKKQ